MTLPWQGQCINLRSHARKQIGKQPPEKPRGWCRPVRGPTIKVMQHGPSLGAMRGHATVMVLHLQQRALATFHRRGRPLERPGILTGPRFPACQHSDASRPVHGCRSNTSCIAWSMRASWAFCSGQRVRARCACQSISGSNNSSTHRPHLRGMTMGATSSHTVCPQQSTRWQARLVPQGADYSAARGRESRCKCADS
jgi:hypothetical protein